MLQSKLNWLYLVAFPCSEVFFCVRWYKDSIVPCSAIFQLGMGPHFSLYICIYICMLGHLKLRYMFAYLGNDTFLVCLHNHVYLFHSDSSFTVAACEHSNFSDLTNSALNCGGKKWWPGSSCALCHCSYEVLSSVTEHLDVAEEHQNITTAHCPVSKFV
jgi:hypothetical protein